MITFKQFLIEGGKATEKLGTERASKNDIKKALQFVSTNTGISYDQLVSNLLGSTRLTLHGHQETSGDIDIALLDKNRNEIISKLSAASGNEPRIIGGNTYSFAIPAVDKKVQVDLMFVPDLSWAKFAHHASEHSAHKSGVRNELLHSVLKFSMQPGKDIRIKDENGLDIVRASRSYNLINGVTRIFKIAPKRKDGNGRVKSLIKVTPAEVQQTLKELGRTDKFDSEADLIRDPDKFAELLFGPGVSGSKLMSAEQIINLIKSKRKSDADAIFKDAVRGIRERNFTVPDELKQYAEKTL